MINNRQAGRRRGRGGGNNGGQRQGGNQGNGSRIDNRARGNATQLYEKYKNMAADAQRAGDRVNTEYYLQFADHYFRVLSEQRGRFEDQQQPRARQDFDDEGEDEFGDEGEPIRANEQQGDGNRFDARDDRGRDREERAPREARRDDGGESRRNGEGRRDWQERDRPERSGQDRSQERSGQDRPRERRPVEAPAEIAGQHRADAVVPGESLAQRAEEVLSADRPLDAPPRRRGRPRREVESPVEEPSGFEADRLPPSLSAGLTVAANDEAPEAKPRRRRARPVGETPTAAE